MKKVFSNSMVAHVWAQQTQDEGRNSSDTFYFKGTEIFSYGSHYLAAKMHKVGKIAGSLETIVLVNSYCYSNSTGKQLSHIERAVKGTKSFNVPRPDDFNDPANIEHFNKQVWNMLDNILNSRTHSTEWNVDHLISAMDRANDYFTYCKNVKPFVLPADFIKLMLEITEEKKQIREMRKAKRESPEAVAKKQLKQQELVDQLELRMQTYYSKIVTGFRSFKVQGLIRDQAFEKQCYSLGIDVPNFNYDLLRVVDSMVQTSGGAVVPLPDALKLLRYITTKSHQEIFGDNIALPRVGDFTLNRIEENSQGKKFIVIGCHQILLEEAQNVLSSYKTESSLKLVGDA